MPGNPPWRVQRRGSRSARGRTRPTPSSGKADPPGPPRIVADRLTFQPETRSGATPLHEVSFHLEPGGALLVAGSTGSGKSTLLRLIAGLGGLYPDPHAAGRLVVAFPDDDPLDEDGASSNDHSGGSGSRSDVRLPVPRPGRVVLVPQSPRDGLVGLDVFSALAMPLEQRGLAPAETTRRVEEALEDRRLLGLMEREVAALSSGEARRIALAGVIAQDAPLVLLDEPFADLEPHSVHRLREDLGAMVGGRTVVIAEHRPHHLQDLVDATLHLMTRRPGPSPEAALTRWPPVHRPPYTPSIKARRLTVARGGRTLLRDTDLDLGPGVWGLIGPNGSGKTSLLWTLAGLLAPKTGTVETAGVPVWQGHKRVRPGKHETRLRNRLQVAFQEPREAFFSNTVNRELQAPLDALGRGGKKADRLQVKGALAGSGRADLGERSPQRLSGGEARFVQLLGALLPRPGVLLLDEPTHGLDADLRKHLHTLLRSLSQRGHLVVVATHEPEVLPEDAGWIYLSGEGPVLVGSEAAPGAPGPAEAGFAARSGEKRRLPGAPLKRVQEVRA